MNRATSDSSIWADDLLNRKPDADFLYTFLKNRSEQKASSLEGSFVLNIDAEWGFGKTFFLDRFATDLKSKGHLVASVNAWKDDHADDPFVAILAAIDEAIKPYIKSSSALAKGWKAAKKNAGPIVVRSVTGFAKTLVKNRIGQDLNDLIDIEGINEGVKSSIENTAKNASADIEKIFDNAAEKLISDFSGRNKAADSFRKKLTEALEKLKNEKDLPLFVLIDELDRCRPSYAVALLERVKHLFDVPNIVFVFATNSNQLQHAIAGAYGPSFDGYRYLKRFFERTYTLELPSTNSFVEALSKTLQKNKFRAPNDDVIGAICSSVSVYHCDLREIQQIIDIIKTVETVWPHPNKIEVLSLICLAIDYIRSGDCGWSTLPGKIPDDFKIDFGSWHNSDGKLVEAVVSASGIVTKISKTVHNLRIASDNRRHRRESPQQGYVDDVFISEWSGQNSDKPSVLLKLPEFIKSAGKLVVIE